jgi:hypothetical protein
MTRGKILAIITGAISIFLALVYLILVELLDFRGEMIPAPMSMLILFRDRIFLNAIAFLF